MLSFKPQADLANAGIKAMAFCTHLSKLARTDELDTPTCPARLTRFIRRSITKTFSTSQVQSKGSVVRDVADDLDDASDVSMWAAGGRRVVDDIALAALGKLGAYHASNAEVMWSPELAAKNIVEYLRDVGVIERCARRTRRGGKHIRLNMEMLDLWTTVQLIGGEL